MAQITQKLHNDYELLGDNVDPATCQHKANKCHEKPNDASQTTAYSLIIRVDT